ncbi:alpha-amylase family glycosyl hydrolase [Foetidibacter luteolus]|uniref:alpha-amylase family glycosyl hydrolase n=1 Tax=Foetidibacter luteolus TaxID=2608880 RepID=UPI001A991BE1|nr:alpha-amylase family glycosyl hydrolase [Foetidibacter luteolus]
MKYCLRLLPLLLLAGFCSCKTNTSENVIITGDTATVSGHPAWIMQGNIYEVNIRQYTPEGTFKAFEKHLDRLKEMGVQTLWFMPITPISQVDRKGALGSYYAAAHYTAVNPEYGTMEDWKNLVKLCHAKGFKVITDWVANHTGGDHYWLQKHPDFYVHDSTGKVMAQYDWTDTRKLNYDNPVLQDSMINCMLFWIRETGIDGFRCDVAGEVPDAFWQKCIPELRNEKNVFMLAEGNKPSLHVDGFDATYTWNEFNAMKKIAKGEAPATALDSVIQVVDSTYPANSLLLYFTSNHDENSWNKADYGTMPGDIHAPFAVFTQTAGKSVPLIYSGQEEPFLDSISFFYKDTITFSKFERAEFYKALLNLRKRNAALSADANFVKLKSSKDEAIYAYLRQKGDDTIMVLLNLSNQKQTFSLNGEPEGSPENLFLGKPENIEAEQDFTLEPWGYAVYVY